MNPRGVARYSDLYTIVGTSISFADVSHNSVLDRLGVRNASLPELRKLYYEDKITFGLYMSYLAWREITSVSAESVFARLEDVGSRARNKTQELLQLFLAENMVCVPSNKPPHPDPSSTYN